MCFHHKCLIVQFYWTNCLIWYCHKQKGGNHTEEGWFDLQRRVTEFLLNEATKEEDEYFTDTGAGEVLYMICSGYTHFKKENITGKILL